MKSFFLRLLLSAFIVGVIAFCNQYGIGNTPKTPLSKEGLLFGVPCFILILVGLSYIFYRPGKK